MLTCFINNTQVNFVSAIVYNSYTGEQSFQHAYFVSNNVVGDDFMDEFARDPVFDPCEPNPCLNGASCSIGFANKYVFFCPTSYIGSQYIFINMIKHIAKIIEVIFRF